MKHDPYSLTELIRNDDFIAWVRFPDAGNETRWQQFLADYPEKNNLVATARGYVKLLAEDTGKNKPTIEQTNKMWSVVESHLHIENVAEVIPDKVIVNWKWVRFAASVALVLGIASMSYLYFTKQPGKSKELSSIESQNNSDWIEKVNNTDKPMTVLLADGSSVVLHQGGQLSYLRKADTKRREVTLKGKAFFEIVKNPEKPFLVYTDGIVTKVLGTSFSVDAPENGEEVNVEVKTGKVSVFSLGKNTSENVDINKPELKGIILNQDQKIAVSRQSGKPVKTMETSIVAPDAQDISQLLFVFDETPASEVFRVLENAYNIKIIYDEPLLKNCPLNATLIGQPFIEKLTVICAALDADFIVKNNEVTITGRGCK
ncbi:FecR family protein [Dyadobacter sp. NIV53]|uniref:FecR family protein n=1 Tax=Dyadobacter sp. NIV53 TaxID=2861765 RepID=UPI001C88C425|nr:FecR family protein [Dyadobacter sp. NIV53]